LRDTMSDEQKAKLTYYATKRRIMSHTVAQGGLYVEDCAPWAIKDGCTRQDCPMRAVGLYEAKETDYFTNCNPIGVIADVLLTLNAIRGE